MDPTSLTHVHVQVVGSRRDARLFGHFGNPEMLVLRVYRGLISGQLKNTGCLLRNEDVILTPRITVNSAGVAMDNKVSPMEGTITQGKGIDGKPVPFGCGIAAELV